MKCIGDCYQMAANNVIENDTLLLVHADIQATGKLKGMVIGHAWNEIGDVVIDDSNGKCIVTRKEVYYAVAKPQNIRRYTVEEAREHLLKSEHYGPWVILNGKYLTAKELNHEVELSGRINNDSK